MQLGHAPSRLQNQTPYPTMVIMVIRVVRGLLAAVFLIVGLISIASTVYAAEPTSPNYRFDETAIGTGGLLEGSSSNFKSVTGTGDTGIGASSSTNFQSESGSRTSPDPVLSVQVTGANANFGSFSATTPATATATFSVKNYTSYGYVAQIIGSAPKYGTSEISPMSANAVSQPGIEQFGMNVVANTSPVSFGANPDNGTAPNNFGFGAATPNYGTPNQFRYVSGESIAQAPKSSGQTNYTISYLVNVTSLTPGGVYASDQTLIVTGTY